MDSFSITSELNVDIAKGLSVDHETILNDGHKV